MLNKILRGTDVISQMKLDEVLGKIGENPNILWYPSAGIDFRDLLEAEIRTDVSPDLYFHTDYCKDVVITPGIIFSDENTEVNIMQVYYLTSSSDINYHVSRNYADFPDNTFVKPTILLLDVLISYNGGQIKKPVLYWYFENINFLDAVLLKFNIPISHIIKVCEGTAWGGSKKSISVSYAFLSKLKTQYLLIDNRADVDLTIINKIKDKHRLELKNFRFEEISQRAVIKNWSHRSVAVVRVEFLDELYNTQKFKKNLSLLCNFT